MSEFDTLWSRRFACPACGARMTYDPAAEQLACPYCGTRKAFENTRTTPNEYDIRCGPLEEDRAWEDTVRVARCVGCGADLLLTGETKAETCPFCGAACAPDETLRPGAAPESLIPFRIPPEEAAARFRRWMRWRLYAPREVRRKAARGAIGAVYLARWRYTDDATSVYQGRAGRYAEKKPEAGKPDGPEDPEAEDGREMAWEPVSGVVEGHFDDVEVAGGERLPESLLEEAGPFVPARAVRYSPEYIAGYPVEKPSADVREAWIKAQRLVDERMAEIARREILAGADGAEVSSLKTTHGGVRYSLALLPAYVCVYRYRKKLRHVLMNGFNGRLSGPPPVSRLRVALTVLLVLALLAGGVILFLASGGSEYMFYDFGRLVPETLTA